MEEKENVAADLPEEAVQIKPDGPGNKKKIILLILLLALAVGSFSLFYMNQFHLSICLEGDSDILLEYGDSYQEPGVQAMISGNWLFSDGFTPSQLQIQVDTDLDENTVGKYTVNYSASFLGWQAAAQRSVRVVDTVSPVITLKESDKTVLPGQIYEEEGFIAVDNYDGNLTSKVHRVEEMGVITYTVMDSSGNPASVQREIPYFDPLPPEIILEGEEQMSIICGTVYTEPGFSASDNADGDMTEQVAVEGEVLWYQPGTYEVAYTVADTYGNVTQKIRKIEVIVGEQPTVVWPKGKVIYLTFDDGPGPDTGRLLDVLKKYGVKATFFVTDSGYDSMMRRIVNEGHSIGIHTINHDYYSIYSSEEAYFEDLLGMQEIIYQNTGVKTTLMRFPGGGSNQVSRYNKGIMSRLTQAVQSAGFQYFDWNVDSNDAGGALKSRTVADNVIGGVQNHRVSVVLQHDIHDFSVSAVEEIIIWGLEHGYQFLPLKQTSPTMHHTVLN